MCILSLMLSGNEAVRFRTKPKPREWWVVAGSQCYEVIFDTEDKAKGHVAICETLATGFRAQIIHVREVLKEDK